MKREQLDDSQILYELAMKLIPGGLYLEAIKDIKTGSAVFELLSRKKSEFGNSDSLIECFYYGILDNNEVKPIGTTIKKNTVFMDLVWWRLRPRYIMEHRVTNDDKHEVFVYEITEEDYKKYEEELFAEDLAEQVKNPPTVYKSPPINENIGFKKKY